MVPPGKTNFLALPLLLRLQSARLTLFMPLLYNSSQSGNVPPLVTAPALSAITSLKRMAGAAGGGVTRPGEPLTAALEHQLAGSSGSPFGLMISSEGPRPSARGGQ